MKRLLCVVLSLSLSAYAADPVAAPIVEPSAPIEASAPVTEVTKPSGGDKAKFALAVTMASLIAAGSTVAVGLIGMNMGRFCTAKFGEPKPMCFAGGAALGGATQLALSGLVIPELFRISGDDPGQLRAAWWKWARWPALAMALSVAALFVASAVESKNYAKGQLPMMVSAGSVAASSLTIDVLGIIGVVKAAKEARKKGR